MWVYCGQPLSGAGWDLSGWFLAAKTARHFGDDQLLSHIPHLLSLLMKHVFEIRNIYWHILAFKMHSHQLYIYIYYILHIPYSIQNLPWHSPCSPWITIPVPWSCFHHSLQECLRDPWLSELAKPSQAAAAAMAQSVTDDRSRDYIWVNYNDLTTTSLEIMFSKGNHPQMALIQMSELL